MKTSATLRGHVRRHVSKLKGDQIAAWCLYALFILLPWIVLPGFPDELVTGKRVLLGLLSSAALLGLSLDAYVSKKALVSRNVLTFAPIALVFFVAISAFGSVSPYASWIGFSGQSVNAVLGVSALVALWLTARSYGHAKTFVRGLSISVFVGAALMAVGSSLALLGLPPFRGLAPGLTPAGVYSVASLYAAVVSVWFVGMWLVKDENRRDTWMPTKRLALVFALCGCITSLFTLAMLAVTQTAGLAIVVLVGAVSLIALALFDPRQLSAPSRLVPALVLFGLSLVAIVFGSPFDVLPQEYRLDAATSIHVAKETAALRGPFGAGPDTYGLTYLHTRPNVVLETDLWGLSFDRASNAWLTWSATWGIVPTVVLAGFILLVMGAILHGLVLRREREDWQTLAVLSSVWFALLATRFVYAPEIALDAVFWLVTGLVTARLAGALKPTKDHSRARLAMSSWFVLSGLLFLVALVFSMQLVMGEWFMARAAAGKVDQIPVQHVLNRVHAATRMNPWRADYALAEALEGLAVAESLAAEVTDEASANRVLVVLQRAAESATRATKIDPYNPDTAAVLGRVYGEMSGAVQGAMPVALAGFRAAVELDPVNVKRRGVLVRMLLQAADQAEGSEEAKTTLRQAYLDEALSQTAELITLNPRRANAYYLRALVLERQGNLTDAIGQIEQLVLATPQDPVLRFELGVLHLRAGNKQNARSSFETAVALQPTYANAKWYLASIYEEAGEIDAAIQLLEDLQIMNPSDRVVTDKLELLRAGIVNEEAAEDVQPL